VAFGSVPLDAERLAGRAQDATVNEVLLAACALALRRALRRREETPARLRALVPVSVRHRDPSGAAALGNRLSFLSVDLPLDERDPARVLRTIRERSRAAKTGGQAGALEALALAADALPGPGRRALVRAAARTVSFNLVISNVPGPPMPLALLGRPLRSLHPMVPLLHGHALSIGAVSYEGDLALGLAADAAVVPDVARVAEDLEAAFDALRAAGTRRDRPATPWATRASARRQRAAKR
jgi:WS/DGAT/MGAT family acyltransferase